MTTALTVYQANAASTTTGLTTANQFYASSSGSPATNQTVTVLGTATGFGEILPRGGTAWAAGGSAPSPSGNGFVLDATTLNSQQIVSGNWSAEVRFCAMQGASQAGTLVADIYVRAYKYSSGIYTNIVTIKLAAQTINSTLTTYLLNNTNSTGYAGSAVNFSTGDKLYCDIILNITTNSNANSTQGVRNNRMSTDTSTFVGDINASVTTPGYQAGGTNVSLTITETATGTETVTAAYSLPITETATGTESVLTGYGLPITETATGSEVVTAGYGLPVTETAAGSEVVTLLNRYNLSIIETATGSEIVTAGNLLTSSVTETATGTESVTFSYGTIAFINETATGLETVILYAGSNNTIIETATGSEIVTVQASITIVESAGGTELVTAGNLSAAAVIETAAGSEIVSFQALNKLVTTITETATGSEIIGMIQGIQSPGNVQMQKVDLLVQYSRIYANVVGPQLKLLATTYYGNATNNQILYGELDAVMKYEQIAAMHVMKTINDVNAFLQSTEYIANVLNDTPIAYYRLTESAGASGYDVSGRGYTSTFNGTYTLGAVGPCASNPDTAITLDGSTGYIALSSGIQPGNWTGLTLEAFIALSNTSYGTTPTILANDIPSSSNNGFSLYLDAGGAGVNFAIGKGSTFVNCHNVQALTASTYYHITCTYNGTTMIIYVNGVQKATAALTGSINTTLNSVNIGHNPAGATDYLPGTVGQVAIYNYALSSTRVLAHYNAAISP